MKSPRIYVKRGPPRGWQTNTRHTMLARPDPRPALSSATRRGDWRSLLNTEFLTQFGQGARTHGGVAGRLCSPLLRQTVGGYGMSRRVVMAAPSRASRPRSHPTGTRA